MRETNTNSKLEYLRYMIHGRETEYSSKMPIQFESPYLVQIMEPQIVSECLRFCIAELSLLFLPPETSWAVMVTELLRPSHPPGSNILTSIYPDHLLPGTNRALNMRRPGVHSARGAHTRRGPLAGAGGLIKSDTYIKWSTVGRQNTAGLCVRVFKADGSAIKSS